MVRLEVIMRRIVLIVLLGSYFGAFAYSGIAPQYALAMSYGAQREMAVSTPFANYAVKATQNTVGIPWPSINIPDLSFLWKQQKSNQKKDIYDRGQ
jgi:O-antigen ligase